MRFSSILLLAAIIASIMAPLLTTASFAADKGTAAIHTLDVCTKSSPSLSVNSETPGLYECPCKKILLTFAGFSDMAKPSLNSFLSPFLNDRPPRA